MFYNGNPFLQGLFVDDTTLIAAGFDGTPFQFKNKGKEWEFEKHLDEGFSKVKTAASIEKGSF